MNQTMTLQKMLQQIGSGSRRLLRQAIADGRVEVNEQVVRDPGLPVTPGVDRIRLDGQALDATLQKTSYFAFHKPDGVVSTLADPQGRPTISHYLKGIRERVYPIGRLDFHSEGLILLTNDGDFANLVLAPKNRIPKVYELKIKGELSPQERERFSHGVVLDGQRLQPFQIRSLRKTAGGHSWILVTIHEGKKHILRRAFLYAGHPVERLKRVMVGTVKLGSIPAGHWRELTRQEVDTFRRAYPEQESRPPQKRTGVRPPRPSPAPPTRPGAPTGKGQASPPARSRAMTARPAPAGARPPRGAPVTPAKSRPRPPRTGAAGSPRPQARTRRPARKS